MKLLVILLNVIFLIFGDLVFNLYHDHDHDHSHGHGTEQNTSHQENSECIECIIYVDNNNYVFELQSIVIFNDIRTFLSFSIQTILINDPRRNTSSRSPPKA